MARILVGIDFSETSQQALDLAVDLAARMGASLELAHVYQIPAFAYPESVVPAPPDTLDVLINENRKHLEAWAEKVRATGLQVSTQLLPGSPATDLVVRATEGNFDLVVVGTHGRTGLRHALLGSVAEKVVRKSPVPVLTVPMTSRETSSEPLGSA